MERPNTNVPLEMLAAKTVLCCGEDFGELMRAMAAVTTRAPVREHAYRGYRFVQFEDFALAWCGIGTGCLEPLLCEVLRQGRITRMVLMGTAGCLDPTGAELGTPYLVGEAWLGGTAIRPRDPDAPRRPHWPHAPAVLAPRSIVSTDFYYGFSPVAHPLRDALLAHDAGLAEELAQHLPRCPLVDMESAQFYHLCRALEGDALEFVAVKAAANHVGAWQAQLENTPAALQACWRASLDLLDLPL